MACGRGGESGRGERVRTSSSSSTGNWYHSRGPKESMRLLPGFLKAQSPLGSRNNSDGGASLANGAREAKCSSQDGGGGASNKNGSCHPPLVPARHDGGNRYDARASSGTSHTSVESMLSSRENPSPKVVAGVVARFSGRGVGGRFRTRATSSPTPTNQGRGGDTVSKPSRWARRRSGSGGGFDGATWAASEMVVVGANLGGDGLGMFPGDGVATRDTLPRGHSGGGGGGLAWAGIDVDDEELMERKRGDGDGFSDEEEEEEEEEEESVLGKPRDPSWSDCLLADPIGVRKGGDFFPSDSPARTPVAPYEGDLDKVGVVGDGDTAVVQPPLSGEGALDPAEGIGKFRRSRLSPLAAMSPEEELTVLALRLELQEEAELQAGAEGPGAKARATDSGWWPRRSVDREDSGFFRAYPLTPAHQPEEDIDEEGSWWSGRRKSTASSTGGEEIRLWRSASALLAQAVSAFSATNHDPSPGSPLRAAVLRAATALGESSAGSASAGGAWEEGDDSEGGDDVHEALVPGSTKDGGGDSTRVERGGRGKSGLLLDSPFFCKENGTDGMKIVLGDPDLRAGFKQFLAKRWCAENLIFVEDVMRYQEAVVRQGEEGVTGRVTALRLGREIEETFLVESSPREINIGDEMRYACLARRARDLELAMASMDTFTPVVFEVLSLMLHCGLQEFRASAHYATIEACLYMGPRGARTSGDSSSAAHIEGEGEGTEQDNGFDVELTGRAAEGGTGGRGGELRPQGV